MKESLFQELNAFLRKNLNTREPTEEEKESEKSTNEAVNAVFEEQSTVLGIKINETVIHVTQGTSQKELDDLILFFGKENSLDFEKSSTGIFSYKNKDGQAIIMAHISQSYYRGVPITDPTVLLLVSEA